MTEHDPEDVGPLTFALDFDPSPFAKIHLHLHARFTFHAPPGQRRRGSQTPDEPLHGLIAADELILSDQILVNPLRRQPLFQRLGNLLLPKLATDGAQMN